MWPAPHSRCLDGKAGCYTLPRLQRQPRRAAHPTFCRRILIDRLLIALLRGYKRWLSPLLGPRCRFVPSCSEYAMQAISLHGALRGGWLAAKRVGRCHPLHPGGFDPPPPRDHGPPR